MYQFFVKNDQMMLWNQESVTEEISATDFDVSKLAGHFLPMTGYNTTQDLPGLGLVLIEGSDVNHIVNVLRMRIGERIRVSNEDGLSALCILSATGQESSQAVIVQLDRKGTELPCQITLFQGLPKGDKMELVIQKAVELGASKIIPVAMKNCVMKLDPKKAPKKRERWQAIAESAAKQSKRTFVPEISLPVSFEEALLLMQEMDAALVPYENERGMEATRSAIGAIRKGQTVGILVGPEGGFSPQEIDACAKAGAKKISLGRRILRTETAGLATLAMLVYALDD